LVNDGAIVEFANDYARCLSSFKSKAGVKDYIDIGKRILEEGVWLPNARTEKKTLSIIGVSFEHDLSEGTVPVVTTKKPLPNQMPNTPIAHQALEQIQQ
jgi:hypothetical protein